MEGKAILFKHFANIDAVPIVLSTQDPDEIIRLIAVSVDFSVLPEQNSVLFYIFAGGNRWA